MELTSCKDEGRKGEGVENVAHIRGGCHSKFGMMNRVQLILVGQTFLGACFGTRVPFSR